MELSVRSKNQLQKKTRLIFPSYGPHARASIDLFSVLFTSAVSFLFIRLFNVIFPRNTSLLYAGKVREDFLTESCYNLIIPSFRI